MNKNWPDILVRPKPVFLNTLIKITLDSRTQDQVQADAANQRHRKLIKAAGWRKNRCPVGFTTGFNEDEKLESTIKENHLRFSREELKAQDMVLQRKDAIWKMVRKTGFFPCFMEIRPNAEGEAVDWFRCRICNEWKASYLYNKNALSSLKVMIDQEQPPVCASGYCQDMVLQAYKRRQQQGDWFKPKKEPPAKRRKMA